MAGCQPHVRVGGAKQLQATGSLAGARTTIPDKIPRRIAQQELEGAATAESSRRKVAPTGNPPSIQPECRPFEEPNHVAPPSPTARDRRRRSHKQPPNDKVHPQSPIHGTRSRTNRIAAAAKEGKFD